MKGLEICRKFYEEYGAPMIEENFSGIKEKIAVGLFGSGSECYGYDDEISRDHDFDAGFCIMLPDESEVDRRTAFLLERAYAKLPDTFMGLKRGKVSAVGGMRRGVIRTADFFTDKVGRADGLLSGNEWFSVPESFLAEAVNGEVFRDDSGVFTGIREYLSEYPEDVRLKKLAGNLLLAGQAGQYNYFRCVSRGDTAAAQLSASEFVNRSISCVFLLNRRYKPYYKWVFRALGELPLPEGTADGLEFLISSPNDEVSAIRKMKQIEEICAYISEKLTEQNLSDGKETELERLAYSVNGKISDVRLRNEHVLYAV
ncbi:MAG: DUF4037 domain-containing protein [Clostridia bacterium]|nr:DUF4037 domain-containing protein [Clostridia bacterium]